MLTRSVVLSEEYKSAWQQTTEARENLQKAKAAGKSSEEIMEAQQWYQLCEQNLQVCRWALHAPDSSTISTDQPSRNHNDKDDDNEKTMHTLLPHFLGFRRANMPFLNPCTVDDETVKGRQEDPKDSEDTKVPVVDAAADTSIRTCFGQLGLRTRVAQFSGFSAVRRNQDGILVTFAKCCVTEHIGDHHEVVELHLFPPKNCPDDWFDPLVLEKEEKDLNNLRNLLMVTINIQKAYSRFRLCFQPIPRKDKDDAIVLYVLDPSIKEMPIFPGSSTMIGKFHGQRLQFPSGFLPFRKVLLAHTINSMVYAGQQGWTDSAEVNRNWRAIVAAQEQNETE